jgi:hypothetical protein
LSAAGRGDVADVASGDMVELLPGRAMLNVSAGRRILRAQRGAAGSTKRGSLMVQQSPGDSRSGGAQGRTHPLGAGAIAALTGRPMAVRRRAAGALRDSPRAPGSSRRRCRRGQRQSVRRRAPRRAGPVWRGCRSSRARTRRASCPSGRPRARAAPLTSCPAQGGHMRRRRPAGTSGRLALDQAYGRPPVSIEGGDQPAAIILGSLLQRAREETE